MFSMASASYGTERNPHFNLENTHYIVFDYLYLSEVLQRAGFKNIRRYDWRQTAHKDYDDYSQTYIPHMDKEHGILISLNVECEK